MNNFFNNLIFGWERGLLKFIELIFINLGYSFL